MALWSRIDSEILHEETTPFHIICFSLFLLSHEFKRHELINQIQQIIHPQTLRTAALPAAKETKSKPPANQRGTNEENQASVNGRASLPPVSIPSPQRFRRILMFLHGVLSLNASAPINIASLQQNSSISKYKMSKKKYFIQKAATVSLGDWIERRHED